MVRVLSESTMSVPDRLGHEIALTRVAFVETSPDPDFDSVQVEEVNVSDLIAGNGTHWGYHVNRHPGGDLTFVAYEGRTRTTVTPGGERRTTFTGAWRYTGGTGKFRGITGGGTYEGHVTPSGRVYTLDGRWHIENEGVHEPTRRQQ